jgi:hypothetical protein
MFHILTTHVLRTFWNTEPDGGSMKHFGKALFVGAVGGHPVSRWGFVGSYGAFHTKGDHAIS